jgi:glycosyltransferase involved in cell wall biosynthesis
MKIAFIDVTTTVYYGGVQTAVWQLAIALTDLGHEVTVFGGDGPIRPNLRGRSVRIETYPFTPRERVLDLGSRFQRIVERWTFARHARHAVAAGGFDWVVLTKPFDFFWPRFMPGDSRTRFAFMSGGTDFFAGDRLLSRRIDAWFACSHFNAWQIKARYKHYPHVMYNGVDVEEFHPSRRDRGVRQRLGVADDEVLFTFAGRLVGWKGLQIALAALAEKDLKNLRTKLLIIGDGDELSKLRQSASELGVSERVIFHPAVPHAELPSYYASADAGVFPSIGDEAFGITIAEAMACGLPVVASHVGGIPEVIGNEGSCGLLTTPGDAHELAAAMAEIARSEAERRRMGEAGTQRIRRLFTWEMAAKRLLAGLKA